MKDRVFSGTDTEEALAAAAATLGLPAAELRYVVLEPGSSPGRGLKPTPTRIAVFVEETPSEHHPSSGGPQRTQELSDPRAGLRALIRAVAQAGALDLSAEIEEGDDALWLHIQGPDSPFFHGADGHGETLLALEHLSQRLHAAALDPLVLRVRCEGFRERRDAALTEDAKGLASQVCADGQPRTFPPMNAYERRIVHVALQDEPGVTTFSVGEGRDRRVTVAPRAAEDTPTPQPDGAPDVG